MADFSSPDGNPAPKRARLDGTFSMEPDIEIHAGGEIVEAHSIILMMSSPVFRQMLTTGMSEGRCGRINLPDKSATELRCFIDSLSTVTFKELTNETAIFLSRWAEEYEVLQLKDKCEAKIMYMEIDNASVRHAIMYRLDKRLAYCVRKMKYDPVNYVDALVELATPSTAEQMRELWPRICKAAAMDEFEMPEMGVIRAMWPCVSRAIRATSSETGLKLKKSRLERIEREIKQVPEDLYNYLPKASSADQKGREWMKTKIENLLRS